MPPPKRLLINWVYAPAIGHTIEACRLACAFRHSNPDLEIGLMLNDKAGIEIAEHLSQIDHVYPVDVSLFADGAGETKEKRGLALRPEHNNEHESECRPQCLSSVFPNAFDHIPPDWDYVLTDPRHERPMCWSALDRCEEAFRAFIRPGVANKGWNTEDFPDALYRPLELNLPASAKSFAADFIDKNAKTRICAILGSGSEQNRTPPMEFWRQLLQSLIREFDNLEIILLGALKGTGTRTQGIQSADIANLISEMPQIRDGFDKGLLNQLALAQTCDLHISPHTGFSFAVQSAGTPWLVLSGGEVAEQLLNGVTIRSIFPECDKYPCRYNYPRHNRMLPECEERNKTGQPFDCLTQSALAAKLPEILKAARSLINREQTYHQCLDRHYKELSVRATGPQTPGSSTEGAP